MKVPTKIKTDGFRVLWDGDKPNECYMGKVGVSKVFYNLREKDLYVYDRIVAEHLFDLHKTRTYKDISRNRNFEVPLNNLPLLSAVKGYNLHFNSITYGTIKEEAKNSWHFTYVGKKGSIFIAKDPSDKDGYNIVEWPERGFPEVIGDYHYYKNYSAHVYDLVDGHIKFENNDTISHIDVLSANLQYSIRDKEEVIS